MHGKLFSRGFAKSSDLSRHKQWQQGADDKKTMPQGT
jgi:hypothetical protein